MEFHTLYHDYEATMLQDAHNAITKAGLWDWLKEFEPHPNEGFMFSSDINLAIITTNMNYEGHSGASFGWTMRAMHDIARNGWESHKAKTIAARGPPCPCRRDEGKLTGWCSRAGGGVPACDH